jgi:hypothetical protein
MAENDEFSKFDKGDPVALADMKPGEWYIIESHGWGYASPMVGRFESTLNGYSQFLMPLSSGRVEPTSQFHQATLTLASMESQSRQRASAGYSVGYFRARQQPKLNRRHLLASLQVIAGYGPTTGSDPEIFIEDAAGNIIPAYEFLPAKSSKRPIFWDGFQAEFTVPHSGCQDGHGGGIHQRLGELIALLPKGARLSTRSVVEIPKSVLKSAAPEHVDFGCRESLNAYGLKGEIIANPRDLPIRFAGGHIHWGFAPSLRGENFEARAAEAVKFVDLIAGLMSVSISEGLDDPRRRRYYGLAGEYRLPAHGIEYRVLSNFWLIHPAVYHLVFTLGRQALRLGLAGHLNDLRTVPEIAVVNAINNLDVKFARELIGQESELFKAMIEACWPGYNLTEQTFAKILTPLTSWGIDPAHQMEYWAGRDCGYVERWGYFITHPMEDRVAKAAPKPSPTLSNVQEFGEDIRPPQSRA